jgi:hypothetical protein
VTGKIAVATASLLALAGLIDAVVAISTKTESLTCSVGISFFWCAPRATIADFAGEWTNKNPESGIVRVRIGQQLDKAAVQIWGRCAPSDCPWGVAFTAASDASRGTLQVEYDQGYDIKQATLKVGQAGRLEVKTKVHFTDDSGRPDYESVDYLYPSPSQAPSPQP